MSDKPKSKDHPAVIRKRHNVELLRRMRSGEALWSFDSTASWFPPRPVIAKDPRAIFRLYGPQGPASQAEGGSEAARSEGQGSHLRLAEEKRTS